MGAIVSRRGSRPASARVAPAVLGVAQGASPASPPFRPISAPPALVQSADERSTDAARRASALERVDVVEGRREVADTPRTQQLERARITALVEHILHEGGDVLAQLAPLDAAALLDSVATGDAAVAGAMRHRARAQVVYARSRLRAMSARTLEEARHRRARFRCLITLSRARGHTSGWVRARPALRFSRVAGRSRSVSL